MGEYSEEYLIGDKIDVIGLLEINTFTGVESVQINIKDLRLLNLFFPPLSTQSRIVSILDTFEQSISNLEEQLAMREKQYEYYRNLLLTFEGEEERGKT